MENLQLFNFEGQKVETLLINSELWFIGKDVATILGYSNTRDALSKHVDPEDKLEKIVKASQVSQNATGYKNLSLINESGVYSLIFGSKMPSAKKFKHWVTSEVLPQIRKTGSYAKLPQTPEEKLALTMQVAIRLDKRVSKVEKKVDYLANTSEINANQRYQLLQARKLKVIQVCGGAASNYYQEKKAKKVFGQFGIDFKKAFQIPRYDSLQKQYFDEAIKFTKNWYPDFVLQREIQNANAQTKLNLL